ncbi:MAG: leucine-rich repeat domain-containing protein [Spirochaetaceae bacterium]|nr:leucine-rich repeat domain-containing protein [Spirochaetaceae bacterium]
MSKRFGEASKNKIFALLCIFVCLLFASCGGGGGGGGGAVSFAPNSNMPHNGGDAGGFGTGNQTGGGMGGTSIEEANSTLLLGQSAALSYQKVDIDLIVNGEHFAINNVTATTTTEVLPKIPIGAEVSGTATIFLDNGTTRVAELEMTSIGIHNNLIFKVPYNYECIDRGTSVKTGTYFSRDGIDLSDCTGVRVAGWLCSDGTMHYGGYITGVRGDITLTAVYKVAVTSNVSEISKRSSLITTLGISADSGGTALKPETAQLSVFGSSNYTYSCDTTKVTVDASGAVSIVAGYDPPLAGETVTITVTDNDDPTLYATVDLTISRQCVLAMYKDKLSHDAETSPDYTKIIGGSDGTTASGNLYALAGAIIEANKSAETNHSEQISDWKRTTPMPMKVTKTSSIPISADTKVYALYEMSVSINKEKIAKPSTLLASLNITQDSTGRAVMPNSAQLTVTGSDGYTFSSSPSGRVNITPGGVVTIAGDPSIRGETVTITATDSNDSTILAQCTIKICKQAVCAIYIDKTTCDATNGTPGYTKILDNDVDSSTSPSMNVMPYNLIGATFEAQKNNTISGWKATDSTTVLPNNSSYLVSGDKKIYAGWTITGIDTSERILWRYTGVTNDNQTVIDRTSGSYSSKWSNSSLVGSRFNTSVSGNNVTISVTNAADLDPLKKNATLDGEYQAMYQIYKSDDTASFTEIPITVKDAIYVDVNKTLHYKAGATIPPILTITTLWGGKTVKKIADSAFENNTTITSITVNGAIEIGSNAFKKCSALTSIYVTGGAKIGTAAFHGFDGGSGTNTVTINISGAAMPLGLYAFNWIKSTSLTLPSSVTLSGDNDPQKTFHGFGHCNRNSGTFSDGINQGTVKIPNNTKIIGGSCFAGAHFEYVCIPKTVEKFEGYAFDQYYGNIKYEGSQAEWNAITKDTHNTIDASRIQFNQALW